MLIVYFKCRPETELVCRTIFGGIVKLFSCDNVYIITEIKQLYKENDLDLKKMVIFRSFGASAMLGKYSMAEIMRLRYIICVDSIVLLIEKI